MNDRKKSGYAGVTAHPGQRMKCSPWRAASLSGLSLVGGCQLVPLEPGNSLRSYTNLAPSDGIGAKALVYIDAAAVHAAHKVLVLPTSFSSRAAAVLPSQQERKLVTNSIDRSLCAELSEKFEIVGPHEPADLTVQAVVNNVEVTNAFAAALSKGVTVVPMVTGVPAPIPRIPFGLGSLSVEAEALDAHGNQKAAMVWAHSAEIMASSATVSSYGDAYGLASKFGQDFGDLLIKGESPIGQWPSLPSKERISAGLGLAPKYSACESFGRGPGVAGMAAAFVGMPPEWTDHGAAATP